LTSDASFGSTSPDAHLSSAEIGTPQSVLEAKAGDLSKRMSDHYKHISEGAARKAVEEHTRVIAEQRKGGEGADGQAR
jgi:hypothetical protein